MSVEALVDGLPAEIGHRVRVARTARGRTLDQLAEESGVSRRMVVNVESGRTNASISTLLRLATALGVSLADLVAQSPGNLPAVTTRGAERTPVWHGPAGGTAELTAAADTPDMLELWDWTLQPDEAYESEAHRRGTRELLLVLSGRLHVTVDGHEHELRTGDSISLTGDLPHTYANRGRRPTRFAMTVFEPRAQTRP